MKVAVIGANGQLGADVVAAFTAEKHSVASLNHRDVEIADLASVQRTLEGIRPDLVINTAAYSNVDKCETEAVQAFAANALGARNVALATRALDSALIHISTDYVFDGRKPTPYTEADAPNPLSVYGNSKLAGEFFVRNNNPRHFVVRVSGIYGRHPCRAKDGLNFVEMMLKLAREREVLRVVNDQLVTPTPTVDVARQLVALSRLTDYGIYHASSEGSCSWYEFAQAIFEIAGTKVRLAPVPSSEFPTKAVRPRNSVMENVALKAKSINVFRPWKAGLEEYLAQTPADSFRPA
ncbi:MAG TPA: dTDP-4-dehydrorhamnose reductase [Alphaproteobacteria bacterium]|nr:dTDP-4-dehydrorhamnose reductase [Alphaproteobacteria bacterium]